MKNKTRAGQHGHLDGAVGNCDEATTEQTTEWREECTGIISGGKCSRQVTHRMQRLGGKTGHQRLEMGGRGRRALKGSQKPDNMQTCKTNLGF